MSDVAARQTKTRRGYLVKSFAFAFRGLYIAFKSERNFKIHVAALCLVVALGLYLGLVVLEWGLIIFSIGLVLVAELLNTAIERLGDKAAGGALSQNVGNAKDISAAAVLLAALTAVSVGVIILFIPFVRRILGFL